jgi:hypothetical protein
MATRTVARPTFRDENARVVRREWEFVDRVDETGDPLGAARGALVGVMLCVPFWLVVLWVLL